jgi:glycosyltransferase involved in cell wall biosynthesis
VVPEKRMDAVIGILHEVRQQGFDVHLHILGGLDDSPFAKKVQALASRHRDWVVLEGRVAGKEKCELMARHKFGINGRQREPFGIAVAELVKAGCITFVPNGGGQTEIVAHPMLTFKDQGDAVGKIQGVLSSLSLQEHLRDHLAAQAQELSAEKFMKTVRGLVSDFLKEKQSASEPAPESPKTPSSTP